MKRCIALTKRGTYCRLPALDGLNYCEYHAPTVEPTDAVTSIDVPSREPKRGEVVRRKARKPRPRGGRLL